MSNLERQQTRSSDKEKDAFAEAPHLENSDDVSRFETGVSVVGNSATRDLDEGLDPEFVKKTRRKVDWRLVPILSLLYAASLIDRTNISLAYIAGMGKELALTVEPRYSVAVLSFFITYIILEVPANMGIRKFGASRWLSSACLAWGAVMIGMGFVHSWNTLSLCRALVGAFEAALFPGAAYLLSTYYARKEMQTRMSLFYLLSNIAGGLSAVLAYGLTLIGGAGGLAGWRWIFIIEGILTVAIAFAGYFIIADFPDTERSKRHFTEEELNVIRLRIERDRADSVHDPLTLRKVGQYALNPLYWCYAFLFMSTTLVSYFLALFGPIIIAGFGYSVGVSQLLTAPPFCAALLFGVVQARFSDRYLKRSPFFIGNCLVNVIGCCLLAFTKSMGLRYFSLFLLCCCASSNVPITIGWLHSCITSQSKRAFGSALVIAGGGVGGILSSVAFTAKESPTYRTGIIVTLALQAAAILLSSSMAIFFHVQNRKAAAGKIVIQGVPGFRYLI